MLEKGAAVFCYVWEYHVHRDSIALFIDGYGPEGEWVQFFRRDPAYIRTELLRDREDSHRFVTIDYWMTREVCMAFRERWRAEFDAIDARYGATTEKETHLGDFEVAQ